MLSDKFTKNDYISFNSCPYIIIIRLEILNYNKYQFWKKNKIIITVPTEYIPDDINDIYLTGD